MFFWWIFGGESGLPVLFLCHLRTASPTISMKPELLWSKTREKYQRKTTHQYPSLNVKVKSFPTLSDPMDCNLPGSSIHGIFQAKYWSGVALPSPMVTCYGSPNGLGQYCWWVVLYVSLRHSFHLRFLVNSRDVLISSIAQTTTSCCLFN